MSELVKKLQLPLQYSEETRHVVQMKERLVALVKEEELMEPKPDRICVTFKLTRDRHGKLQEAAAELDMTITDVLTLHIDDIIPVLEKAKNVSVPGYRKDLRVQPKKRRAEAIGKPLKTSG